MSHPQAPWENDEFAAECAAHSTTEELLWKQPQERPWLTAPEPFPALQEIEAASHVAVQDEVANNSYETESAPLGQITPMLHTELLSQESPPTAVCTRYDSPPTAKSAGREAIDIEVKRLMAAVSPDFPVTSSSQPPLDLEMLCKSKASGSPLPSAAKSCGTPAGNLLDDLLGEGEKSEKKSSPIGPVAATSLLDEDDENDGPGGHKLLVGARPNIKDFPETKSYRPPAEVSAQQLEEQTKCTIFIIHSGEITAVSWMKDTSLMDTKEAILCACDAMANSSLQLRELITIESAEELERLLSEKEDALGGSLVKIVRKGIGQVWYKRGRGYEYEDFAQLQDQQLYLLEDGRPRDDLLPITGDRKRRYAVAIDPLQHYEAIKAIRRMRQGANLLKHTSHSYPHLRFFQLSADLRRLIWYSGRKSKEESTVQISSINEVKVGMSSKHFEYVEFLRSLTFRICFKDSYIDLSAKDEEEFDEWLIGLKALACWSRKQLINKMQLLGHCRRFKNALENDDFTAAAVPHQSPPTLGVNLLKAVNLKPMTRSELVKKEERLRSKLKEASLRAADIDFETLAANTPSADESREQQMIPNVAGCAVFESDLTDAQMEYNKMLELIESVRQQLDEAVDLLAKLETNPPPPRDQPSTFPPSSGATQMAGSKRHEILTNVTQLLWKADIDTENLEDIHKRLTEKPLPSLQKTLAEINVVVHETAQKMAKSILTMFGGKVVASGSA